MSDGPRILTLDIETGPAKLWSFGPVNRPVFISIDQVIEPDRVICFAAKWVGDPRVKFFSEFHQDHEAMRWAAFSLLDEADAVVTYNGDNFDIPHLERMFQENKMGRPSPFASIDLYKVGKKHQRQLSHKLAYITERLGLSGKLPHHGFMLWRECMGEFGPERQRRAWNIMRRYNKQDVVTTEELYFEELPYIDNHPTATLYVDDLDPDNDTRCPRCLQETLQRRGYATTRVSKFRRYHCTTCGAYPRGKRRLVGVDLR